MFIIEAVVSSGGVLECIILKGVSDILPLCVIRVVKISETPLNIMQPS